MSARAVPVSSASWVPAAVASLGLLALALRLPGPGAVVVVGVVGAAGAAWTEAGPKTPRRAATWLGASAVGLAAFAVVRVALGAPAVAGTAWMLAAGVGAGVAEEAFFRRFLYGRFLRWGAGVAIFGTAVAFAAVHVAGYGWPGAALDLGAGLILGWQRWMTGGWTAPALTHAAANLMVLGVIG